MVVTTRDTKSIRHAKHYRGHHVLVEKFIIGLSFVSLFRRSKCLTDVPVEVPETLARDGRERAFTM